MTLARSQPDAVARLRRVAVDLGYWIYLDGSKPDPKRSSMEELEALDLGIMRDVPLPIRDIEFVRIVSKVLAKPVYKLMLVPRSWSPRYSFLNAQLIDGRWDYFI